MSDQIWCGIDSGVAGVKVEDGAVGATAPGGIMQGLAK
jgi:hypothetical protein